MPAPPALVKAPSRLGRRYHSGRGSCPFGTAGGALVGAGTVLAGTLAGYLSDRRAGILANHLSNMANMCRRRSPALSRAKGRQPRGRGMSGLEEARGRRVVNRPDLAVAVSRSRPTLRGLNNTDLRPGRRRRRPVPLLTRLGDQKGPAQAGEHHEQGVTGLVDTLRASVLEINASGVDNREELLTKSLTEFGAPSPRGSTTSMSDPEPLEKGLNHIPRSHPR